MSPRELAVLPRMIANANLFILNWDVTYYYADADPDVDEYMVYLTENVGAHGVHRGATSTSWRTSPKPGRSDPAGARYRSQYAAWVLRARAMAAVARSVPRRSDRRRRLVHDGTQDGLDRSCRRVAVVASLEDEREAVIAELARETDAAQCHVREARLRDEHAAERVDAVDVLPGRDEDRLRRELPHDGLDDRLERVCVVGVGGA